MNINYETTLNKILFFKLNKKLFLKAGFVITNKYKFFNIFS